MRRLLAITALVFVILVAGGAAADTFAVRLLSETNNTLTLGWDPQSGYGYLFFSGDGTNWNLVSRTSNPNQTSATFSKGPTSFKVSVITEGNTGTYPPVAPPPVSAITQTIQQGSTIDNLNGWRAVYDANNDGTEDDPGSVQFLIDGTQVLQEINAPFGDTFATGTITTSPGQHTFVVRALNDGGTVLATNTVTATVGGSTPPPQPTGCALPAHPDASCTGVPAGVTLTPRAGPITITTAGTVLQNIDITYAGPNPAVSVNAPNVTIRNIRVRSNGIALIQVNVGGSLTIEDSELFNQPVSGQPNCHNGIATGSYTARRLEIAGCENGAEMGRGNVTFEDNYIHDLDTVGPSYVFGTGQPHTDGVQLNGGAANIVIHHNTIDPIGNVVGGGGTSGIIGNSSGDNVRIDDNMIDGGESSYAIYAPRTAKSAWFINRNRLGRGVYGYTACVRLGVTVTQFDQNTDMVTGALVAPDEGVGGGCSN